MPGLYNRFLAPLGFPSNHEFSPPRRIISFITQSKIERSLYIGRLLLKLLICFGGEETILNVVALSNIAMSVSLDQN